MDAAAAVNLACGAWCACCIACVLVGGEPPQRAPSIGRASHPRHGPVRVHPVVAIETPNMLREGAAGPTSNPPIMVTDAAGRAYYLLEGDITPAIVVGGSVVDQDTPVVHAAALAGAE